MKMTTFPSTILLLAFFFCCISCGNETTETSIKNPTNAPVSSGHPVIDGLTKEIAESPDNAELYANRAGIWMELEGYDEAIVDLRKAIYLDSLKPEYHHELGNLYMDYYKSRLALQTMENAGVIFPKRIPTLLKLSEFQMILKQYERALYSLERIRVMEPNNPEMYFMFGNVFEEMERIPEAKSAYQNAVEQNPDLVDAWIKLGQLLSTEKNPLAARYLDNAIRIAPENIGALHAKANYLSQVKDNLPEAIALFKKVNVIDPQFEEGYYNLGLLYLDADSLDKAYQSFDLAIKIQPMYAESYFFRGMASKLKGDLVKAKNDFQQALRFKPDYGYAKEELGRL
ncbi:MAG: tetratricopeptide (TPR) repeat protein [Paraglaciecola sp.]|jgi:tetratricopeptide (TPR) repeat protein